MTNTCRRDSGTESRQATGLTSGRPITFSNAGQYAHGAEEQRAAPSLAPEGLKVSAGPVGILALVLLYAWLRLGFFRDLYTKVTISI